MRKSLLLLIAMIGTGSINASADQEPKTPQTPIAAEAHNDVGRVRLPLRQKTLPWVLGKKPTTLPVAAVQSPIKAVVEADEKQKISQDGIVLDLVLTNEGKQNVTISNPLYSLSIDLDDGKQRIEIPHVILPYESFDPKQAAKDGKLFLPFKLRKAEQNGVSLTEEQWNARFFDIPANGKLLLSIAINTIWPEPEWKKINPFTQPPGSRREMELPQSAERPKPKTVPASKYKVFLTFVDRFDGGIRVFGVGPVFEPDFITIELIE